MSWDIIQADDATAMPRAKEACDAPASRRPEEKNGRISAPQSFAAASPHQQRQGSGQQKGDSAGLGNGEVRWFVGVLLRVSRPLEESPAAVFETIDAHAALAVARAQLTVLRVKINQALRVEAIKERNRQREHHRVCAGPGTQAAVDQTAFLQNQTKDLIFMR